MTSHMSRSSLLDRPISKFPLIDQSTSQIQLRLNRISKTLTIRVYTITEWVRYRHKKLGLILIVLIIYHVSLSYLT